MTGPIPRDSEYRPISAYGVIGNQTSVALVGMDGGVDWCCLPRIDSPAVFAAILDARRGGTFLVRPAAPVKERSQRYLHWTNVLVTLFQVEGGLLEVSDFMPVSSPLEAGGGDASGADEPAIYRRLRCTAGDVEVEVLWAPRLDYGRGRTRIETAGSGYRAEDGRDALWLSGLPEGAGRMSDGGDGPVVHARFPLRAGDERYLRTRWGDAETGEMDPGRAGSLLQETVEAWRSWVDRPEVGGGRPWVGEQEDAVVRSELFLKLMSEKESGALAAAPTTSLPETLGGVRNWDYRYAWIRDAAQIAQAFFAVGHPEQMDAFVRWAEEVSIAQEERGSRPLRILHPLHPERDVSEVVLDHLEGYRHSAPVRTGNAAADQLQIDVYGELLNLVFERVRLGGHCGAEMGAFLAAVADETCRNWRLPDFGIWEMKNGPFHQVYSKVMAWVALDRALWLLDQGELGVDPARSRRWSRNRDAVRAELLEQGWDDEQGSFVQGYGRKWLDAANLLIPVMEFLPAADYRVQGTVDRTLERLTVNDLVYRYRSPDHLPGEEGAFVLCTWWLVDALALSDRLDEAHRVFEGVMARRNHVGLLSEQIDPHSGEFLGNFPQAYSHLGLINSTLYLAARAGKEIPVSPLLGLRDDHRTASG